MTKHDIEFPRSKVTLKSEKPESISDTSIFCGIQFLILEEGQGGKGSKQKQNEFMNSLLCCVTLQNVHNISAKTQF